jgi:Na+-translocating ferredoxin:NAD+ oxidoreductase RnfC subunit
MLKDELINKIKSAGVVGCGGAGFPTHVKLNASPQCLIINGIECEPVLFTDRYLMRTKALEIVQTVSEISEAMNAHETIIAIKSEYVIEKQVLQEAIEQTGANMELKLINSYYPAGDEQMIVYEVTGKSVPPGGIPLDVDCVVINVGTVFSIKNALDERPFIRKYITVSGNIDSPTIMNVPIGTTVKQVLKWVDCTLELGCKIIMGGPMMGKILNLDELESAVIEKTTSGLIVLNANHILAIEQDISIRKMLARAKSACIQCSYCTQMCPRNLIGHPLMPHMIMRALSYIDVNDDITHVLGNKNVINSSLCSECGVCEAYACPMGLKPRKINAMLKELLRQNNQGFVKDHKEIMVEPYREYRKIPSKRLAMRIDMNKYSMEIENCLARKATHVSIPTKQHVGTPAEPITTINQRVREGDLIALCPENQLGANIHASITGVISGIGDGYINIDEERT